MEEKNPARYWAPYLEELKKRVVDGALNTLRYGNPALNKWLRRIFEGSNTVNSLMADPVFEAVFPWKRASRTMEYLSNTGLLSEDTLRAIDQKNAPFFRRTWRPFSHQAESFKLLLSQDRVNSVIVSSGTGSGKTECFLIPLIEDMARELRRYKETGKRKPRGVRALFLYPLNGSADEILDLISCKKVRQDETHIHPKAKIGSGTAVRKNPLDGSSHEGVGIPCREKEFTQLDKQTSH